MKKIILACLAVMSLCFAELRVDTQEKKVDIGFFIGGGIGVGANAMNFSGFTTQNTSTTPFPTTNQSFASFVASLKAGVYHFFISFIGLRGYYNLDLNVLPMGEYIENNQPAYESYIFSSSHTINADVIINVFSQNNMDVAVIGGMGLGALVGELNSKYETLYGNVSKFLDFEFRFNLGAKVLFNKKYGVEFMAKVPVISTMIWADTQVNRTIKYSPYYFTIDFVMERF